MLPLLGAAPAAGLALAPAAAPRSLRGEPVPANWTASEHPAESSAQSRPLAAPPRALLSTAAATAAAARLPQRRGGGRGPRLYFLFLAIDQVFHFDVWTAFFAAAPPDQFRVFLHCRDVPHCKAQVAGSHFQLVPPVPTVYCTDLVTAQNQLLTRALAGDFWGTGHPRDKFIYVSDTTLPAKPFAAMYRELSSRPGSDICTRPVDEWKPTSQPGFVAVKHHQWIVLNRAHAEQAATMWGSKREKMVSVPNSCLDEVWYMWALYGLQFAAHGLKTRDIRLDLFTGDGLRTSPATVGTQGKCDTFAIWRLDYDSSKDTEMYHTYGTLDPASMPTFWAKDAKPGIFTKMSIKGMRAIRDSPFLFIRKIEPAAKVVGSPEEVSRGFSADWIATVLT